jgi:tRNA nucleotidyltransferase (CCA-adding enzyme)
MADYIYLLESRLTKPQQSAIQAVREIAREKGLTVFLVGGAVRDLTSGSPVRDLDVVVQGNALKLKKELEKVGASIAGEYEAGQTLFLSFPGVRMEVGSTLSVHYPKPGKPVAKPATILDDLRRRDFTANAMALSLNEGSYGLLMDPLNGVADIENRELRLVSNYGFIEAPERMIRAARFAARLGWQLEEKTQARYETGKAEGYISALSDFHRGYEAEEIVHEEDPLRVMRRLESEGWMNVLSPAWNSAKANPAELEKLREAQMQLQMQGILADSSAAQFPMLTAKVAAKDVAALKSSFPRKGFVAEMDALEGEAKKFAADLGSKHAATPSATWKLLTAARPEVVLWVAYSTKSAALQAKFKSFYTEWPLARQRIPYPLMQEMRIVPELAGYDELVEKLFFELMDGRLGTVEEMKAFLEPFSPPAPPPPVNLRRARAAKKEGKPKSRKKAEAVAEPAESDSSGEAEAALAADVIAALGEGVLEEHMGGGPIAVAAAAGVAGKVVAAKAAAKPAAPQKASPAKDKQESKAASNPAPMPASSKPDAAPAKTAVPPKTVAPLKTAATKPVAPARQATAAKAAPAKTTAVVAKTAAKAAPVKAVAKKAVPAKKAPAKVPLKAAKPAAPSKSKVVAKAPLKAAKTAAKLPVKPAAKSAAKPLAKTATKAAGKVPSKAAKPPVKVAAKKKR